MTTTAAWLAAPRGRRRRLLKYLAKKDITRYRALIERLACAGNGRA